MFLLLGYRIGITFLAVGHFSVLFPREVDKAGFGVFVPSCLVGDYRGN